jgi:hypothetical protein
MGTEIRNLQTYIRIRILLQTPPHPKKIPLTDFHVEFTELTELL